jgi:hypothetical protein
MRSNYVRRGAPGFFQISLVAIGLSLLAGCGSSGSGTGSGGGGGTTPVQATLAPGGAASVYVLQGAPLPVGYSVLSFSTTTGSVLPTGTLTPSSAMVVHSVVTDGSGHIYVAGELTGNEVILEYAAGSTGSAVPFRTLILDPAATDQMEVSSMFVDNFGTIYATGLNSTGIHGDVAVIQPTQNGQLTPSRFLTSTQLTQPIGIGVDATGEIFVTNLPTVGTLLQGSILVFGAGANGSAAPTRVITGPTPTSTTQNEYYGITVGATGNIYTVFDTSTYSSSGILASTSAEIQEFAAGASGAATPINTISGVNTGLTFGGGLRADVAGNLYLVNVAASPSASQAAYSVVGFGPQATGNMSPGLTVTSGVWNLGNAEIGVY